MEPGNLADSYRRSVRIVPIVCQSKRRDVCTAAQRGRGDTVVVVKIFYWEGEPQQELDTATTTTSLRILQLIIRSTAFTTSGVPPSSHTAYSYKYTTPIHSTAIERTVYAPGSL